MRSKLCEDGTYRILAKVVVPMGVKEITMFALANPLFEKSDDALNRFQSFNKRELFNLAKESVSYRGDALPTEIVSQLWSERQVAKAEDHVKLLFPEVT